MPIILVDENDDGDINFAVGQSSTLDWISHLIANPASPSPPSLGTEQAEAFTSVQVMAICFRARGRARRTSML